MRIAILLVALMHALSFGQQKQKYSIAVLPSINVDGSETKKLTDKELDFLTEKVREIAIKILPVNEFTLLKQNAVIDRIGAEEFFKACREGSCVGDLAKRINVDYATRCDVSNVNDKFTLKFELYSVKDDATLGIFSDYANDIDDMRKMIEEKVPAEFKKMLPSVSKSMPLPAIQGGIGSVETSTGGTLEYGVRRYLVNLNTEPKGAIPSFNGVPISSCNKTPCKVELQEGNVRIVAALDQYETLDTTISIKQNHQNINLKLKYNFGFLKIKPAYSDGISKNKRWNLSINGKAYSDFENKFSPGTYDVKLSHECYEDISFKAGINKDTHEIFEMSEYLNLKQGVLILSAEKDGEPVSEPIFANGKHIGETPFNGAVPVCAKISIGENNDKVDIKVLHNQTVRHKHLSYSNAKIKEKGKSERKIFSLGFRTGVNSSHIYESYRGNSGSSDKKVGFHVGSVLDIALSEWFHLQPSIMYIQKGAEYEGYNEIFHYIEMPVLVSLKLSVFRFNAGPYFSRGIDDDFYSYGFSYGFGLDIENFYIGMFYDYGLKNITHEYHDLDTYNRTLGFTLGYNL